jgi:hypothetical protein
LASILRVEELTKEEISMKQAADRALLTTCFMQVSCSVYCDPEAGGDMFLLNIG